jgi:hypothetical protein
MPYVTTPWKSPAAAEPHHPGLAKMRRRLKVIEDRPASVCKCH